MYAPCSSQLFRDKQSDTKRHSLTCIGKGIAGGVMYTVV